MKLFINLNVYYNCLNCFMLHKSFGKHNNFFTCYITSGAPAIIANFTNIKESLEKVID